MSGSNNKVFAQSLACLGKVGKEVVINASKSIGNMTLSTFNDAKTAFVEFTFDHDFFEKFAIDGPNECSVVVKVPLKSLLSSFKNIRNVDRMTVSIHQTGVNHLLQFKSMCKGGMGKTYTISFEDSAIQQATFKDSDSFNRVVARTSLLNKALDHIYGEEAAISLLDSNGIRIKSHYQYVDKNMEYETLKTDMAISLEDLDDLRFLGLTEIAFAVREMKALLQFCDANEILSCSITFGDAGEPFRLSSEGTDESFFRTKLIMATLRAEEIQ